jgi:hypothetical protein
MQSLHLSRYEEKLDSFLAEELNVNARTIDFYNLVLGESEVDLIDPDLGPNL